jgi:ABC-2 type transport system permease protein
MQNDLVPGCLQSISRFNPVNWSVEADRSATSANTDWSLVDTRIGFLAILLLVGGAVATKAFAAYQRSI